MKEEDKNKSLNVSLKKEIHPPKKQFIKIGLILIDPVW